ncbi:MAG: septum formation initiator [Erythrobacter sp.]
MGRTGHFKQLPADQAKQGLALLLLLGLSALAIAGPTGLLAWSEHSKLLDQRNAQIAMLSQERNELRNRVDLLATDGADPDLVGELLRRNMNVVHADEIVITLEDE